MTLSSEEESEPPDISDTGPDQEKRNVTGNKNMMSARGATFIFNLKRPVIYPLIMMESKYFNGIVIGIISG